MTGKFASAEPLDFFLLRVPRLPLVTVDQLNAQTDSAAVERFLLSLFRSTELQDAIFLASEALYGELKKVLENGSGMPAKMLLSLYKYTVRMAARPTPYGKFAGISLGEISVGKTAMTLSGYKRAHTRLDMAFASHLTNWALENTNVMSVAYYQRNSSLVKCGDHYRFVGYRNENGQRRHDWIKVSSNPILDQTLTFAMQKKPYSSILSLLIELGLQERQSRRFLTDLIDAQLLVSDLTSVATQATPVPKLAPYLRQLPPVNSVSTILAFLDHLSAGDNQERPASAIAAAIPCDLRSGFRGSVVQGDLHIGTEFNSLEKRVAQTIAKELIDLWPLNQQQVPIDLADFCKRFAQRYGQRKVRLMDALDPDRGIGYGDSAYADQELLDDLGLMAKSHKASFTETWIRATAGSLDKVTGTLLQKIELTSEDMAALGERQTFQQGFPTTWYAMGNLIHTETVTDDKGDFLFNLQAAGGVSAVPIMARYCHLDRRLEEKLRTCTAIEDAASPDVIFAEIVFLPNDRAGNVMLRPSLRSHGLSLIDDAAEEETVIPLTDLWVTVSGGNVLLQSDKLGKRIVPRLSCAHNFTHSPSIYRFLCDLQHQDNSLVIQWDWGHYGADRSFLPRVTYKHIVLTRARWFIRSAQARKILMPNPSGELAPIRQHYALPRWVIMAEHDHELLLDLDHFLSAEILVQRLKSADVILYEYISSEGKSPVQNTAGEHFANELIIPFRMRGSTPTLLSDPPLSSPCAIQRVFPPGTEWAYLKLYTGAKESDRLLDTKIRRLLTHLEQEHLLQKWFFVRYADPDYHIRLRILLPPSNGYTNFPVFSTHITHLFQTALEKGKIFRAQYDTYERELERYGPDTMELCESIFQIDSETTLQLLPHFKGPLGPQYRRFSALVAVDDLLSAFKLPADLKRQLVETWRDRFFAEFGIDKTIRIKLDAQFRKSTALIESFFRSADGNLSIHEILKYRRTQLSSLVVLERFPQLFTQSFTNMDLLCSLSHMFINRHFFTKQREQEMVIYHHLEKTYRVNLFRTSGITHPGNDHQPESRQGYLLA